MPPHRQEFPTPREDGIRDPPGGLPSPPDAVHNARDAMASQRIVRLSG